MRGDQIWEQTMNNSISRNSLTGKKQWYLLAYDIRQAKRLSRTHYFVKKKGVGLQRSVYLVKANKEGLAGIIAGIRERVHDKVDDVRLYPIHKPGSLWAAGKQSDKINILYAPAPVKGLHRSSKGVLTTIRKLFMRKKSK